MEHGGDLLQKYVSNLKLLRNQAGITQQELADRTGLTRSRINNYEQGVRKIEKDVAATLADFFNVDLDYFYALTSSPSGPKLRESESVMLEAYRELNSDGQLRVYDYILDLIRGGRYTKE